MVLKRIFILFAALAIFSIKNTAQVNADFSANLTSGCGTLAVSFSDLSTSGGGTIVSWDWDLGGVNVMTQQAGRIFPVGTYDICLTVIDNNGISDTECKTGYIQVFEEPTADFEVDISGGCSPLNVVFTDLSNSPDGNIVQWIWGVGGTQGVIVDDGTLAGIENTYIISDEYDISLTITDENGCLGTVTQEELIIISPNPDLDFSASSTFKCTPPFLVNFTNENIESNITYTWDFGNGDTHFGSSPPTVNYTEPGSYDVRLIGINNSSGCMDTLKLENYIVLGNPVEFSVDKTTICEGDTVSFEDLTMASYDALMWDFGDGNNSTEPNPTHVYNTSGCFTVSLTREEFGCSTTKEYDVCIEVIASPTVSYTADNSSGCSLPHVVNFVGNAPDAVSWDWTFGENGEMGTSANQNPTITFDSYGIYPVYLTVTNSEGCYKTIVTDTIRLIELESRIPDAVINGCGPLTFELYDISYTNSPITSWLWEINTPSGLLTSTNAVPTFTIVDTGCYNVKLSIMNESGCTAESVSNAKVCVGMPPAVDFAADPQSTCINSTVYFTDLSSSYVNEWFWIFGDSTFSFLPEPGHEYVDTGNFDVTLIATHHGCSSSITKENFITTLAPKAVFSLERLCDDPYTVNFSDGSIDADTLIWDFGDPTTTNDTSSQVTPQYIYPDTGLYSISLITQNFTTGCIDTMEGDYYITEPKASFSVDTTSGCVPLTISIENNSIFAESYYWTSPSATFSDVSSASPTVTFATPGVYNDLQLIITDENGCEDSITFNEDIFANGVTPDFTFDPPEGCNPLSVNFQNNSSSLFGNIVSNDWNIGNGLFESGDQNTNYTFETVGNYSASLTVEDDWGCEDSLVLTDVILVTQPTAKFKADTLGCTISEINFLNTSLGIGLDYEWDFGDGGISTEKHPTHNFMAEGEYTVCLTITDINGCTDNICKDNFVKIANPIAAFTSDNTAGACPPLIVSFENQSQNALTYEWSFGDGSGSSSLENPPHVYTSPGTFDVSLIAIANDICRDTFTFDDFISLDGPAGTFTLEYDEPCIPTEVTFYAESNDYYTYIWDFGDGILDTSGFKIADTVTHLYTQNFDFAPNLILIDGLGCIRAIPPVDTIDLVFLENNFEASITEICNNNIPVAFSNSTESSIPITSVEWYFEGGTPSFSADLEPDILYENPGVFDVMLIVDNGMCKDTMMKYDYIKVNEMPTVDFVMTPDEGCSPLNVSFIDMSSVGTSFVDKWDWKLGNTMASSSSNPVQTFTEDGDVPILLIITTNEGCQDSTSQMLTVFPAIEFSTLNDTTLCNGEVAQLNVAITSDPTGVTFGWLPDPTLSCTNCLDPIANPTDTTTYTFVATTADNCQYETSVTVNVRNESIPTITISPDTTICSGDLAQIFVSGGDNIFGYDWDHSAIGLSCYDACQNPIATPAANTTYTVTVTNTSGCSNVAETTVNVFYEFQDLLGEDKTICKGEGIQLQIQTGTDPYWMTSDGLNCSLCPDPIASPQVTTTYVVRVESNFGCQIYDSITITVLTEEDISAGEDLGICIGQSIQLNAEGSGIPKWLPDPTLSQLDILNPIAMPTETTMYYFTLENGDCILMDSVEVLIQEKTEIDLIDQYICDGESLVMQPIGAADNFIWSPPVGLSATDIENPIATPTESTRYTVIATLGSCESDTASAVVEILENPQIEIPSLFQFFPGESVLLDVQEPIDASYAYQWTPAIGLTCTDCPTPTANIDSSQTYVVIATDLLTGCSTSKEVRVQRADECSDELISMPNAFSPNFDGFNDTYKMYSGVINEIEYFRVFNRWGAVVYESDDRYFAWNGTLDGKKLPRGVYIYLLAAKCNLDGSTIIKKGDITLHY